MSELAWALSGSAGLAAVGFFSYATVSPRQALWGPVHYRSPSQPNAYALTFDDGPTSPYTQRVLDLLGELQAPAAFFVIGRNVRGEAALLRRMDREGHIIANHSFDHSHLGMFRGGRYWNRQIENTDAAIADAIGRRPAMFRPPLGMKTWHAMGAAGRRGQAVVTWSRRAVDGISTTPQRIIERLGQATRGGDVLLLHDGREPRAMGDRQATIEAIKPLILRLRQRGLQPMRLDDLLNLPAYLSASAAAAVA